MNVSPCMIVHTTVTTLMDYYLENVKINMIWVKIDSDYLFTTIMKGVLCKTTTHSSKFTHPRRRFTNISSFILLSIKTFEYYAHRCAHYAHHGAYYAIHFFSTVYEYIPLSNKSNGLFYKKRGSIILQCAL